MAGNNKGYHLVENTQWTYHLYKDDVKVAEIFDDSVFFVDKQIPSDLKELNKVIRIINKAAKETAIKLKA